MKKLPIIFSSAAVVLSAVSFYFAYTTNSVLRNTLTQTDLFMLSFDVDRLQYDLTALAKNSTVDDSTIWAKGNGVWEIETKELNVRFSIPDYWAHTEPENNTPTMLTTFTNNMIDARKWSFSAGGNAMGWLYPDIEAYKGYYPHDESFLATLEDTLAPDDQYIMQPEPFNEVRFAYEKDSAKACASFEKLVLAHSDCKQVDDRTWYVEYATYTDDGGFAPGEPWIVGGFMWFVSLEGTGSEYNGLTIGYQTREKLETRNMDMEAADFLANDVQSLKTTGEFDDLQSGVNLLLQTLKPF